MRQSGLMWLLHFIAITFSSLPTPVPVVSAPIPRSVENFVSASLFNPGQQAISEELIDKSFYLLHSDALHRL